MPDTNQKRSNSALWLGLFLTLLGILSNFFYFFSIFQATLLRAALPWINLILPAVGLLFLFVGLKRSFSQSQLYGGKIWGSIVTVLSVVLFALSTWGFVHAREVPRSGGAPQVGQRLPEFTLTDSTGQPVSLAQLFTGPAGSSAAPKAVLLIFYRGYW